MSLQLLSLIIEDAKSLLPWQKILAKAAFTHEGDFSQAPEIDAAISRLLRDVNPFLSDKVTGEEEIAYIDTLQASNNDNAAIVPRLVEISEYQNVNALSNGQKINFAPKLTLIYGENGSGKSGYNRVLNSAFYSRGDKKILPNILLPKNEQRNPSAKFVFDIAGQQATKLYPSELNAPEFKQFACFDSKTVPAHLEDSNELYVIPREMSFFDKLVQLIGHADKRLQAEIEKRKKPNNFSICFDGESLLKDEIKAINANTDFSKISAVGLIKSEIEKELQETERQYHELKATDPKKMIAELALAMSEIEDYAKAITSSLEKCDENAISDIRNALEKLKKLETAIAKSGTESFKTELLKTLGSEKWRQFITSASTFVQDEGVAQGRKFPADGDSCPLCLQKLEEQALKLFDRYFEFLSGQMEKDLKVANEEIKVLERSYDVSKLTTLSSKQVLSKWLDAHKLQEKSDLLNLDNSIKSFYTQTREKIMSFDATLLVPITLFDAKKKLEAIKCAIEKLIKSFDEVNYAKKLQELSCAVTLMKHKLKFLELSPDIEKFIKTQKWVVEAANAAKTINTRAVTEKQKRIFDEYFTKQYRQVFFREVQKLHVDFNIDVKPKGSAGKSFRRLDVLSYSPAEVLSEGEQRAIAIADFLTEIEICNLKGGVIFDDPVNSLDHERKSYIAKRLVEESCRRQVIIFTHDMSFLFDLINEAERQMIKEKEDFFCHWITKVGENVGLVNLNYRKDLESDYKTHTRAEEFLLKAKNEAAPNERERLCQQGFDSLRKTYEAFVLTKLFGNTVKRFDRQIGYAQLKNVYCPKDIAEYVYDRLGYCSGFVSGHLHPDSYSGGSATPDLLEREIDTYLKFKNNYEERRRQDN